MQQFQEIGRRIKGLRLDLGLSKSQLARTVGVTTTAVWNWEENGRVPRYPTFDLVAKALNVSPYFLRIGIEENLDEAEDQPRAGARAGRTVAAIIDEARREIAGITAAPLEKVRLSLEILSS